MATCYVNRVFTLNEVEYQIYARVEADAVQDSYGVPGSPVWTSYEDLEIDWPIDVNDQELDEIGLQLLIGPKLADQLSAEILEFADNHGEWL